MSKNKNTHTGYRDPKTGQFITERKHDSDPDKYIRESIPNPGRGDTDSGKKKK